MIVVMPNGSLPRPANMPRSRPERRPSPEVRAAMEAFQSRFTDELMKDVDPIRREDLPGEGRSGEPGIAGLSMGGGQTLRTHHAHPDQFAYVGIWSAGLVRRKRRRVGETERGVPGERRPSSTAASSCCRSPSATRTLALTGSKSLAEVLEKHGIKHEVHISGGGHTWINWRHYLRDFAPKLFQPSKAAS